MGQVSQGEAALILDAQYRSISPMTMSIEPTMAGTSAIFICG
jgi:hypothetical protein